MVSIDCGGCFQRTDPPCRACLPALAHMHMDVPLCRLKGLAAYPTMDLQGR
jgi:hypothetical protein